MVWAGLRERIRTVVELSETLQIVRRYVALSIFDGVMIGIGAMFGFYLSNIVEYRAVVLSTVAIMLASAISGFTGAFISERTEQELRLQRLQSAVLHDLRGSLHDIASVTGPLIIALVNSAASIVGLLVVITPYWLGTFGLINLQFSVALSLFLALSLLTALGYLLGRRAKKRAIVISRMVIAGVAAMILIFLLQLALPL